MNYYLIKHYWPGDTWPITRVFTGQDARKAAEDRATQLRADPKAQGVEMIERTPERTQSARTARSNR